MVSGDRGTPCSLTPARRLRRRPLTAEVSENSRVEAVTRPVRMASSGNTNAAVSPGEILSTVCEASAALSKRAPLRFAAFRLTVTRLAST
jgi:hypothetical protein